MQDARYESGLDNSPMYDGEFYDTDAHHMMLYDVGKTRADAPALVHWCGRSNQHAPPPTMPSGMTSYVVMELDNLAYLAVEGLSTPRPDLANAMTVMANVCMPTLHAACCLPRPLPLSFPPLFVFVSLPQPPPRPATPLPLPIALILCRACAST